MKIMTFNLRFENDRDGPDGWEFRKDPAVQLIDRYAPSIVGTQEGTCSQIVYLRDHLPDYHLHTPDRVYDDTCQYPTLFVRKSDFDVLEGAEFWLSRTPFVHRSKNWDSAFPRMISFAKLKSLATGQSLSVAVTHLDHMSSRARYEQAKIVIDWVQRQTGAVILMGDFNDGPESPVHTLLVGKATGLRDTWHALGREDDSDSFTHHGFTGIPQKGRLDWILISPHIHVREASVIKDHRNGRFPSDHFPYLVTADLI